MRQSDGKRKFTQRENSDIVFREARLIWGHTVFRFLSKRGRGEALSPDPASAADKVTLFCWAVTACLVQLLLLSPSVAHKDLPRHKFMGSRPLCSSWDAGWHSWFPVVVWASLSPSLGLAGLDGATESPPDVCRVNMMRAYDSGKQLGDGVGVDKKEALSADTESIYQSLV